MPKISQINNILAPPPYVLPCTLTTPVSVWLQTIVGELVEILQHKGGLGSLMKRP